MSTDIRLAGVSVDCEDPMSLGDFYRRVLALEVAFSGEEFVALKGAGVWLTFQRVQNHQRPDWPEGPVPKQLHLELAVSELDTEEARILALGATKADVQTKPDAWRVLIDPAGHPFCITAHLPNPNE